jgi:aryl-alcohol dehydrogenase-like predicted oxidoreductase
MERIELGRSGIEVTRVVLGCANFGGVGSDPKTWGKGTGEDEAFAIMDAAYEAGIRTFDSAASYGGGRSEATIGRWLAERGRGDVLLTSKAFFPVHEDDDEGLAPERIRRVVHDSLRRLGVDRIDLYLTHQPDPDTPLVDTLGVLDELVSEGTIRAFGASNADTAYIEESLRLADSHGLRRIEWIQNEYSLLVRDAEREVLPLCAREGLGFTPYSPLAGGWLTAKYRRDEAYPSDSRMTLRPDFRFASEDVHAAVEAFAAHAEERGVQPATLAFAWVVGEPGVTAAIAGPSRLAHLAPLLEGYELELSAAERDELAALFP